MAITIKNDSLYQTEHLRLIIKGCIAYLLQPEYYVTPTYKKTQGQFSIQKRTKQLENLIVEFYNNKTDRVNGKVTYSYYHHTIKMRIGLARPGRFKNVKKTPQGKYVVSPLKTPTPTWAVTRYILALSHLYFGLKNNQIRGWEKLDIDFIENQFITLKPKELTPKQFKEKCILNQRMNKVTKMYERWKAKEGKDHKKVKYYERRIKYYAKLKMERIER